jgi:V8-like Glu-specific endopeptidase
MCTGTLVAPNMVLTAAHCLYDQATGRQVAPSSIVFEAGLDRGRAVAERAVAKTVVHPEYRFRKAGQAQIGFDIAVLRLEQPISNREIKPLKVAGIPQRGDAVGVISYTYRKSNSPSLEERCHVLAKQVETLVMSCNVEFGASGAPVLSVRNGTAPQLVSVISAKAAMGNRRVSIGTAFGRTLQAMLRRAG